MKYFWESEDRKVRDWKGLLMLSLADYLSSCDPRKSLQVGFEFESGTSKVCKEKSEMSLDTK